jgi:hypothetical protein
MYGLKGRGSSRPVLAVEARPDGSVAWQNWLEWDSKRTRRYRAYPRTTLGGEFRVDPTPLAGWRAPAWLPFPTRG